MPEVKCTVSNCQFWAEENVCVARQILITAGEPQGNDKFGQNAARMRQTPAPIAENTYCWSFISRDEDDAMDAEEAGMEQETTGGFLIPPML